MASEMPVLPLVGSRIVQPGRSTPVFSACSIIFSAGRSLIEPVGLRSSSLAHRRTSGAGESVGNPTSGVPPTESRRLSKRIAGSARPGATRDGREHDDLVAVGELGAETAGEPDVLVVDVEVHEAAQVVLAVLGLDQPVLDAGVSRFQVVDQLDQRGTGAVDRLLPSGVRAQNGRDADLDGHGSHSLSFVVCRAGSAVTTTSSSVTSPSSIL